MTVDQLLIRTANFVKVRPRLGYVSLKCTKTPSNPLQYPKKYVTLRVRVRVLELRFCVSYLNAKFVVFYLL